MRMPGRHCVSVMFERQRGKKMKTENMKNFWASVFVVAMFLTTTATVIAIPPQQSGGVVPIPPGSIVPIPPGGEQSQPSEGQGQPSDEGPPGPPGPSCTVLWNKTWSNGDPQNGEGESGRITTDCNNNVYGCGWDNNLNAIVIKYNPSGVLQWTKSPTSYPAPEDLATLAGYVPTGKGNGNPIYQEIQAQFLNGLSTSSLWDIIYDSYTNTVIMCGWATIAGVPVAFAVKLNVANGNQIWSKTYSFLQTEGGAPMATAVAVDTSNGNIYLSGLVMRFSAQNLIGVYGFVQKIGPSGLSLKTKIDDEMDPELLVYTGVDVDSSGYPYASGYLMYKENNDVYYKFYITKRDKTSLAIIDDYEKDNDMFCVHMTIDKSDNNKIYAAGACGSIEGAMLLKMTSSLDFVYESITYNEMFQDVAIKVSSQHLVLATAPTNGKYTIALAEKTDGSLIAKFELVPVHQLPDNHVTATAGVFVDNQQNVVASGGIGAIDTIKCQISGE